VHGGATFFTAFEKEGKWSWSLYPNEQNVRNNLHVYMSTGQIDAEGLGTGKKSFTESDFDFPKDRDSLIDFTITDKKEALGIESDTFQTLGEYRNTQWPRMIAAINKESKVYSKLYKVDPQKALDSQSASDARVALVSQQIDAEWKQQMLEQEIGDVDSLKAQKQDVQKSVKSNMAAIEQAIKCLIINT
jgi:hypothetical protein